MFEKEAEEFERRKHYRYEDNDYCGDIADGIIQAYQQGAEFGYNKAKEELEKENAELKEQLGDKVMQKRKDKADLVWKLKTANEQKKSQLAEAKELIGELISSLSVVGECGEEECELLNRAEQFLNSEVEE